MDDVQRAFYAISFDRDFHAKKGAEFERWFVRLASHVYGSDFENVKAAGSDGDFKADGRRTSRNAIYQCYAPQAVNIARLNAKINADFHGAKQHWPKMQEWILVLNINEGLPARSHQKLDELREANSDITIDVWGRIELKELLQRLELWQLQDVFGYAPSAKGINTLALEDIIPIIDDLAQQDPELGKEPVAPPSVDKLQRNALSDDVMELLRVGRLKEHLVSSFLAGKVKAETGERIAEAFRQRYSDLKKQDHPPDIIFGHLQQYAGADGEPKRQTAGCAFVFLRAL